MEEKAGHVAPQCKQTQKGTLAQTHCLTPIIQWLDCCEWEGQPEL